MSSRENPTNRTRGIRTATSAPNSGRFWILLVISLLLVSCDEGSNSSQQFAGYPYYYEIDPLFQNLSNHLEGNCGSGISPLFSKGNRSYQYTKSCLFVFDPDAPAVKRYYLYPLGRRWGVEEPPEPKPESEVDQESVYINGHVVWDEILGLYIRIGSPLIGRPLTGVRFNAEENRYEQYFENMGFYRAKDDPVGDVKVLSYGVWMCGTSCLGDEFNPRQYGIPATPPYTPVPSDWQLAEKTMLASSERLGRNFTGPPIGETNIAVDGMYEKVFQNVIMFVDPRDPARIQLRPLPLMINIEREPPVAALNSDGMYFFPVLGEDLGYNVPDVFMEYITLHGTIELIGPPIGELHSLAPGVSRQCFTNLCLEYHARAPKALRIRPSDLGLQYLFNRAPTPTLIPGPLFLEQLPADSQSQVTPESTPIPTAETQPTLAVTPTPRQFSEPLNLQVWERYPVLSPPDPQEIGVALFEGNRPLSDVGFSLVLTMPDNSQKEYVMPLTGLNGISLVSLEPIDAALGTVIPYQVCITNLLEFPVCVNESFIIWGGE